MQFVETDYACPTKKTTSVDAKNLNISSTQLVTFDFAPSRQLHIDSSIDASTVEWDYVFRKMTQYQNSLTGGFKGQFDAIKTSFMTLQKRLGPQATHPITKVMIKVLDYIMFVVIFAACISFAVAFTLTSSSGKRIMLTVGIKVVVLVVALAFLKTANQW